MKRLLVISLTVLLSMLIIVSCSPDTQIVEDEVAIISFDASERQTRSLTRTNPILDANDFYWYYTATKTDANGLTTGATSSKVAVKTGQKGLSGYSVGPFSYGDWSFTLYGYASYDANAGPSDLAYEGTSSLTIKASTNTLAVTVKSRSSGANGKLELPEIGNIAITGKSVDFDYTKFVEEISITSLNTEDAQPTNYYNLANDTDSTVRTISLASGSYSVKISYLQGATTSDNGATYTGGYAVAEETIYVTIADYLTTKIGGTIAENTGDVVYEVSAGVVKVEPKKQTLEANEDSIDIKVAASPSTKTETATQTEPAQEVSETTVSVPATLVEGVKSATISVTSYSQEAAASSMPTFEVQGSASAGTTELVAIGGLDIDLYINDSETKTEDFAEGQKLTITTYVAKNLNGGVSFPNQNQTSCDILIKYNGTGKSDGTVTKYNAETGELTFTVDHLSSYYIAAKNAVAYNTTTKAIYSDLYSAVEAAPSGSTIKLLCDYTGGGLESKDSGKATYRESLTIDFNNHTYTVNANTVGSVGTTNQAMHWGVTLGAITLKNGTFTVAENVEGLKMGMQNYIKFTAENMILDFTKMEVQTYGESYREEYPEYVGKERLVWGDNENGYVTLKNSTVKMNAESTYGVCESYAGRLTLENSKIEGWACINEPGGTITLLDSASSITNGVKNYFDGHTIETITGGNVTIYRCKAEAKIGDKYYATLDDAVKSLKNAENKTATISILEEEVTLGNLIDLLGDDTNKTASATNLDVLSAYNITFVGTDSDKTKVKTRTEYVTSGTNRSYNDARGASLTFKNMTVWVGYEKEGDVSLKYSPQGFMYAGSLSFDSCKIEGYGQHWGKTNTFTKCTFSTTKDWCIDIISFASRMPSAANHDIAVTFKECEFSSGTGEFIDIYPSSKDAKYTITVDGCTFNNTWSASSGNENSGRAAVFIKTQITSGGSILNCDVIFKGTNTYTGTLGDNNTWKMPDENTYKSSYDATWEKLFAVVDKADGSYKWSSLGNITVKNGETTLYQNTASTT